MSLVKDPVRVSSGYFNCFRLLALSLFLLLSVNAAAGTPVPLNLAEVAVALRDTRTGDAAQRHVASDLDSAIVVLPPPPPDNGSTGDDVLLRVER